jgi:hypothetical protein
MNFLSAIIETIQYIRKHGWREYRKARVRYDRFTRLNDQKVSKREKIDFVKQIKKQVKR